MNSIQARIERVMRERGCSFAEAAGVLGRRSGERRRARRARRVTEEARLTRVRGTWAWKGDFEL